MAVYLNQTLCTNTIAVALDVMSLYSYGHLATTQGPNGDTPFFVVTLPWI
jgi:hypothetical protein